MNWLKVVGKDILINGCKFIPAGCGRDELEYGTPVSSYMNQSFTDFADDLKKYGANMVRLPLNAYHWLHDWSTYRQDITDLVNTLAERGIYSIIDYHVGTDVVQDFDKQAKTQLIKNPQPLYDFWESIANNFKDQPAAAIYSLLNEPPGEEYGLTRQEWTDVVQETINRVSAINPNVQYIIHTMWGATDPAHDLFPLNRDVIWAFHIHYRADLGWTQYAPAYFAGNLEEGKTLLWDHLYNSAFSLLEKDKAVIIDEYNFWVEDANWQYVMVDLLNYCKANHVGHLYWSYRDGYPYSLNEPGYENLSPQGQIWVKYLPTPISPLRGLLPLALIGGIIYLAWKKKSKRRG